MTATPDEADVTSQPRVVLDEDGLDRLELVLGGWLPTSALAVRPTPGDSLVLADAENTPLADVIGGATPDDLPTVRPLQPLARGSGPQWDPAVRLDSSTVRARLANDRDVVAIDVDLVPTQFDTGVVSSQWPSVVLVRVGRRGRPRGQVGWAGLTRAAWALADAIDAERPDRPVLRLVVPAAPGRGTDFGGAGIAAVKPLSGWRSDAAHPVLPALGELRDDEIDALYPPASAIEIRRVRRPAEGAGAVVFFTGLSGSGKSTIARALADELADEGPRRVTLLDGDEVRQHLSRGLGFDAASREINVDRIAWVASLVAAHGGIAVAAPIAPFTAGRRNARALVEAHGIFLLVWVSTPLDVCEARDRKGLYAKARAGEVDDFTGISSPYEEPDDADVVIDTTTTTIDEATAMIVAALDARRQAG